MSNIERKAAEILKSLSKSGSSIEAEKKREKAEIVREVSSNVSDALKPTLNQMLAEMRRQGTDTVEAISKVQVTSQTPEVIVPSIEVPKAEVTVRQPRINIPDVKMPDKMNVEGFVSLMGIDLGNPLPVQLRTADGGPLDLMKNMATIMGGSSNGGGPRTTRIINGTDDAVNVTGDLSATLTADTGSGEIGTETLRIVQATNAVSSVNIVSGSASGTEYANGATALTPTGAVAMGNTGEESGNVFALSIGSGVTSSSVLRTVSAVDSVSSVNVVTTAGLTDSELRASSFNVGQVSGANWSTEVTNTVTVDASNLVIRDLVNATDSVSAYQVSGASWSTVASGVAAHDSAVSGNPVLTGLEARSTNPTAVGDGDAVRQRADLTGRSIAYPVQVRGLLATAFAAVTNGTETTLLSGASSTYHDLVWVMGANHSDAAVQVDIRSTVGGNIVMSLDIPANSTSGIAPAVPYPAADVGATWTVDLGDDTQDCDVTALFSKEI